MDPGNTKNTMKLKSELILRNKVEEEEEYRANEKEEQTVTNKL